jgi:hypothetical protein
MNSNLAHNLLTAAMVLVAATTAGLSALGCVSLANGALDCSDSVVPPAYSGAIIAGLGVVKLLINVFRDGVSGLTKPQPPVDKTQK